ncbi:MAG TPA: 1,4-alpha-glucan branching protein GlgB [Holophagaceae bacterium]|nr:1,4-alpha-glucan branching protein GlgB [Holophagaceae bacterium]
MAIPAVLDFDQQAFLDGAGGDWAAQFGMALDGDRLRVRTFQPGAEGVEVIRLPEGGSAGRLEPLGGGVFEGRFSGEVPFPYRLRLHRSGGPELIDDPYRFPSLLGDLDHHLLAEGQHGASYTRLGAHPCVIEEVPGVAFAVWAPSARRVSVVGDFNQWDGRRHPLRPHSSGVWDLFLPGLEAGALYKFEILGKEGLLPLKADPFALRCEPPPRSASVVHGLRDYPWRDATWMAGRGRVPAHRAPMSVYEVHLGSWRRREDGGFLSYLDLARDLVPYVRDLGFTHLELLPVMEHPFYGSWGYQPLGLFAPTSRFGSPEDFKAFVDACHGAGLGLLLDWVPAHFPEDGHGLGNFDGTHLYEHADPRQGRHQDWNTLVYNYGRHEVRDFLLASAHHWLDQYHADGLRVDAVASMLYSDYSRPQGGWIPNRHGGRENLEAEAFLRRMNASVYGRHPGVVTVAEESTAWPGVSRPVDRGGLGFGFKWNMGWMHDVLSYLHELPFHRVHHHDQLTFSMLYQGAENFVLPLSHDEVVYGKGSLLGRMPGPRWERFANLRLLLAYQHAHGGKKLLFMGGEFGQEREWDHETALDWFLLQDPAHRGVHSLVRDLNHLHRTLPALHQGDCEPWGFQWIDCGDREHSVLAILRRAEDPSDFVVAVFNFSGLTRTGYRVGVPAPGRYAEILNTASAIYGGGNEGNLGAVAAEAVPFHGHRWSLPLTLPPLGAVFLRPG